MKGSLRYIVDEMAFQVINHNMNLQTALIINTLSKVSLDRQNWYTDLKKMMMMMTTRIINGWNGQNRSTHFDDFQVLPNVPQSRLKNQPRLENVSWGDRARARVRVSWSGFNIKIFVFNNLILLNCVFESLFSFLLVCSFEGGKRSNFPSRGALHLPLHPHRTAGSSFFLFFVSVRLA